MSGNVGNIPTGSGIYRYTFKPEQVITDPDTGEEIRILAGYPVLLIIIVHDDGNVEVTIEGDLLFRVVLSLFILLFSLYLLREYKQTCSSQIR